ncbi:MAG: SDR family oxidoreductase [Alphaproteobacteria bacterium]|nr:SDR family oxidoreductase [Alphaproteobacteria bacterium]
MGLGLAAAFARRGARLGLTDVHEKGLTAAGKAATDSGGKPWVRRLDATDATAVGIAIADFAASAGGIDLTVNAAGVRSIAKVVDLDPIHALFETVRTADAYHVEARVDIAGRPFFRRARDMPLR